MMREYSFARRYFYTDSYKEEAIIHESREH